VADIPTRIARVELRCSNVELSADYYARLVGLEVVGLGSDQASLRSPGEREPCLLLHRAERPGRAPARAAGLFHTAFRYPGRPALAAALARIGELGASFTGASDHGVSEALYLDDPDGLGIELYRDRPVAEWPAPHPGERVRMFTAPLDLADLAAAAETAAAPAGEIDIGHVHLKVADVGAAVEFWTERVGMELMTRFGPDAAFLGRDGYHHHVGVNSWQSADAAREPLSGPGLDQVTVRADAQVGGVETPDGIAIELAAH
jgi:catechol 2,3-dioxygenase